jgi:hypothetical protein
VQVIRPGRRNVGDIKLVEISGERAILKDYCVSSRWFRATAGRYMARREMAAYRRLKGVRGVPRLIGSIGGDGLVLEYIEGAKHLNCLQGINLAPEFFDQLRKILQEIRNQGVLHGDVGSNVVMGRAGEPHLLDFGASFVVPRWSFPFSSYLIKIGGAYDERAVLNLKHRFAPKLLTPLEEEARLRTLPWEGLVNRTEKVLHRLIRLLS